MKSPGGLAGKPQKHPCSLCHRRGPHWDPAAREPRGPIYLFVYLPVWVFALFSSQASHSAVAGFPRNVDPPVISDFCLGLLSHDTPCAFVAFGVFQKKIKYKNKYHSHISSLQHPLWYRHGTRDIAPGTRRDPSIAMIQPRSRSQRPTRTGAPFLFLQMALSSSGTFFFFFSCNPRHWAPAVLPHSRRKPHIRPAAWLAPHNRERGCREVRGRLGVERE